MKAAVLAITVVLGFTSSVYGKTIIVDLNGGGDYTEIRPALDAAEDGDEVLVKPGEYVVTEPITFEGKAMRVKSDGGAEMTTIRMSETPAEPEWGPVIVFHNGETTASILEGFTVTGGSDSGISCRQSSPRITECTISGNSGDWSSGGGGVDCDRSSPTLMDCIISGNWAVFGGGLSCNEDSFPALINCRIRGNSALAGGGVGTFGSGPTFKGCTISGNSARRAGGVYCSGHSVFERCTITGNSSVGLYITENITVTLRSSILWENLGGSVVLSENSRFEVSYSCVDGETLWPGEGNIDEDPLFCGWSAPTDLYVDAAAAGFGDGSLSAPFLSLVPALEFRESLRTSSPCLGTGEGGSNMGASDEVCTESGSTSRVVHVASGRYRLLGATLAHGASIEGVSAEETILEGTVWGLGTGAQLLRATITEGQDGGIVVAPGQSPVIAECRILANSAVYDGGGVYCGEDSSPTLTHCTISENRTTRRGEYARTGGGLFCGVGSSPTLINCTISNNTADYGVGVWCEGSSPTFANCVISGNSNYWGYGGGLGCTASSPRLTSCVISGNSVGEGGGLDCWNSSSLILTNCTISGNSAWDGGGVGCYEDSSLTLTNCTISGNSAESEGGGVLCYENSSPTLTSCIVWGNTPESVCGDLTHCLTDQDPLFVRRGEWVECATPDDPLCVAYQWEPTTGEPTAWHRWDFDYHLQPGSPAIDAGTTEGAPTFDMDGKLRPCGSGVDIGAYEYGDCGSPVEFQRGDANADGSRNITDAVFTLLYLFQGGAEPPCLKAADADNKGDLNVTDAVFLLSFLFQGGELPPSPFPDCGWDVEIDELTCVSYERCQ